MPLTAISIKGYRSIQRLHFDVDACSIFIGANGVGKTNLYKALGLLRSAADGNLTRAIAQEGGIESVLWAGKRQGKQAGAHGPVGAVRGPAIRRRSRPAYATSPPACNHRGRIPRSNRWSGKSSLIARTGQRKVAMMERKGPMVALRNEDGVREVHKAAVLSSETALAAFRDASRYPEIELVRRELLEWRLYHDFRTDEASPIRQPCHAITTPTLSSDGSDLAAVLATLFMIREDTVDLAAAIDDAFPGARLDARDEGSWCRLEMQFPDMPRPFGAHELSDGTLKYLCLLGALMGYRLPSLIALNEPEASLHPSLLPPLARLIAQAAQRTRIWIVTHSEALADALYEETGKKARRVIKEDGATNIEGLMLSGEFRDDEED